MTDFSPYKQKLEEEKNSLTTELETIARQNPNNPNEWEAIEVDGGQEPDPNDQAQHLDEYQENRSVVDVLNARYQAIQMALSRIEDGTYGMCSVCSEAIDTERLGADPAASTCTIHTSQ